MANNNNSQVPAESLDVQSLALRAQKKLASRFLSNRLVMMNFVLDPLTSRLLDHFYRLLKEVSTKKVAEKVIKNCIKIVVKLNIMIRNDQVSTNSDFHGELPLIGQLREQFRNVTLTICSFHRISFTYDSDYLIEKLRQTEAIMHKLMDSHLSDKSQARIHFIFQHVTQVNVLNAIFNPAGSLKQTESVQRVVNLMNEITDLCDQLFTKSSN